jgi:hypothetical protein
MRVDKYGLGKLLCISGDAVCVVGDAVRVPDLARVARL